MYNLKLAEFTEERDLQTLYSWRKSTDWRYLVSERKKITSLNAFRNELSACHKKYWKEHRMILDEKGMPVGTIFGYLFSKDRSEVTIGTYVQRRSRSNPAIASAFVRYCELFFNNLGVETIICDVYEYNERVVSLLSRIGFKQAQGFVSLRRCGSRKFGLIRFFLHKSKRSKIYNRLS
tara:strand:- start:3743 stop:4276 length:534 start_codon:yes stop_codon:yes gene_type:complete